MSAVPCGLQQGPVPASRPGRGAFEKSGGSPARAAGFTMIEVLVALVVLALGLLGFALLQTMNLRYAQSANFRTQATNLAYDLIDQMRANRLQASAYTAITVASFNGVKGDACSRPVTAITPVDSMARWRCQVRATLGEGATALVTRNAAGVIAVQVNWADARNAVGTFSAAANAYGQVTVTTQL